MKYKKPIILVAAVGDDFEIGINNELPWKMSGDLKMFKELTSNHIVLMGRNTYDSIGKPLPNRINIVVSSNKELQSQNTHNLIFVETIQEGLLVADKYVDKNLYVIGGAKIYEQFLDKEFLPKVFECHITHVHTGNTEDLPFVYFPDLKSSEWLINPKTEILKADDKNQFDWQVIRYIRKNG